MPTLGDVAASVVNPWTMQQRVGLTDGRYALNSMLMPISGLSYIDYRSGVLASGDTAGVGGSSHMAMRVQPGNGMEVTVEPGNAIINTPNYGAYMACLDSRKTLTLSPASTSTNRVDLIIARVYDDNNPAIGSPAGERRFTVEVWTGDASTGTATRPTPTPASGWIPLAEVRINATVGAVTATNITDLRGPGLVARGGMRALYGADAQPDAEAYQEAGAYPGDQRWVHTDGFQHQVWYGGSSEPLRGGWRGVHNCMVYNANPDPGGLLWTKSTAAPTELCRVHIPYPGTPFMIYPTGRGRLTLSKDVKVDLRISLDEPNGTAVNWNTAHTLGIETDTAPFGKWGDTTHTVNVPPIMFGAFDRSLDVVLSGWLTAQLYPGYGFAYAGDDTGANLLSVNVYPSTVQPPTS